MAENKRFHFLDGWRGLAVLCMLVWHFVWDLLMYGAVSVGFVYSAPWQALRYFIICSFTLISGMVCPLSRNAGKRGLMTFGFAMVITLVTVIYGDPDLFGALHLMGCCMMLWALVGKFYERLPQKTAGALSLLLFFLTRAVPDKLRVAVPFLWMFGLRTEEFYSSDYYPLIPWAFLFFAGASLGFLLRKNPPKWLYKKWPAPLDFLGRRALPVYLIHQPVFMAVMVLIFGF